MFNKTVLYEQHLAQGGKMVDFAGWMMPIHYGSQLEEHHAVRQDAGVFDVSHMAIIDVQGPDSKEYLRHVLANDVQKLLQPGKALYSCMLNEQAGIIDDLIVYFLAEQHYRLVVNAGTRDKDWTWLNQQLKAYRVNLSARPDLAILAVQGPKARQKVNALLPDDCNTQVMNLASFQFVLQDNWLVARTGYTGEQGYEIMLPTEQAVAFWQALVKQDIRPCGLGARDTLRLEAGLNLYGADMDETTTPYESNLAWTVSMQAAERQFIGRSALEAQTQQGLKQKLVGLILEERGVLRGHQTVYLADGSVGQTTSGTFSPTLAKGIALARVPVNIGNSCQIDMRGKRLLAQVVHPPFVRAGKV
jgi:aminomethyltransferase